jgi:hypothetical protein
MLLLICRGNHYAEIRMSYGYIVQMHGWIFRALANKNRIFHTLTNAFLMSC